jgi:hypothetical protein
VVGFTYPKSVTAFTNRSSIPISSNVIMFISIIFANVTYLPALA